jgi:hypothetical protein
LQRNHRAAAGSRSVSRLEFIRVFCLDPIACDQQ